MEGEEGEGLRLSKRFSDKVGPGEVDYKTKSGTAWSHSYLNQKPWHPLSYPNQRRKWIAEQTNAQRERRAEEVSREYAQEQEFFRQAALVSKKEKEKMEVMKAVSFMYVRPPGYNAESAKAAEIADESKRHESSSDHTAVGTSGERAPEPSAVRDHLGEEKKKPRPKDVFGRPLPTEEEFEILKNAPRMETGVPARVKPFGVEVRNVKCLRCGNYGHQSGDRECPLKDAIMPNEQSRLKRDDPLTAIIAHTDPTEPLKWELKQKPGISPPRGGFEPDDPNQQIVAEDIFDEYGGFLGEDSIPNLLTKFSSKPRRKKSSSRKNEEKLHAFSSGRKSKYSKENESLSSSEEERKPKSKKQHKMKKRRNHSRSSPSDESDFDVHHRGRKKHSSRNKQRRDNSTYSSEDSDSEEKKDALSSGRKSKYSRENETLSPSVDKGKPRSEKRHKMKKIRSHFLSSPSHALDFDGHHRGRTKHSSRNKQREDNCSYSSADSDSDTHEQSGNRRFKRFYSSKGPESDQRRKTKRKHRECLYSSEDSAAEKHRRRDKDRFKHFVSSEEIHDVNHRGIKRRGESYYSSKTVDHYRGDKSRD